MWKDKVEKRFFWASMGGELEKLLYELVKAEEAEDTGIYLLKMHYDHAREEDPFSLAEKQKILRSVSTLIKESKKHQRILQKIIFNLEKRVRR